MGNKASRQTVEQKAIKDKIKDHVLLEKMKQLENLEDLIKSNSNNQLVNNNQLVSNNFTSKSLLIKNV